MNRPYVLVENFYGSHQSAVFCDMYAAELEQQNLADAAAMVLAWDAYTENPTAYDWSAEKISKVENSAYCGWETILEKFRPEEGFHLGHLDHDQALFAIPDGWSDEPQDCPQCGSDDVEVADDGSVQCWNCGYAAASVYDWNSIVPSIGEEFIG